MLSVNVEQRVNVKYAALSTVHLNSMTSARLLFPLKSLRPNNSNTWSGVCGQVLFVNNLTMALVAQIT